MHPDIQPSVCSWMALNPAIIPLTIRPLVIYQRVAQLVQGEVKNGRACHPMSMPQWRIHVLDTGWCWHVLIQLMKILEASCNLVKASVLPLTADVPRRFDR